MRSEKPIKNNRFSRLLRGNIVGIIDSYGAVHSVFTGERADFHADHFEQSHHCQWRWNHRDSIHWICRERKPNDEEFDAIQRHLTKRYGLQWWENGHHDIDDLCAKCDKEAAK